MQYDRITVEMIEQKEFKQKVRGYDPDEVDAFLDDICDELIALQDEIDALNLKINQLQSAGPAKAQAVPAAAPVEAPKPRVQASAVSDADTESLKAILLNAQKVSDQTIKDAQERAEIILEKARAEAGKKLSGLEEEHEMLQEQVETLRQAARDYRDRFNQLIDDQKHLLAAQNELFE